MAFAKKQSKYYKILVMYKILIVNILDYLSKNMIFSKSDYIHFGGKLGSISLKLKNNFYKK